MLSSASFLITRTLPSCSVSSMRPSGTSAIAVGLVSPVATLLSSRPLGTVAGCFTHSGISGGRSWRPLSQATSEPDSARATSDERTDREDAL